MAKLKTQAQLDRATDARLRKIYGISLADYNSLCEQHQGCCWICKKPPTNRRLHTEHDHSWKKAKVLAAKNVHGLGWVATADYNGVCYMSIFCKTKSSAIADVKMQLRGASVRGVCCAWCNRGLRFYHDSPKLLRSAAAYLERFHVQAM